jgi:hypothetical protein
MGAMDKQPTGELTPQEHTHLNEQIVRLESRLAGISDPRQRMDGNAELRRLKRLRWPAGELKPLWLMFPYQMGSLGWRMGRGEEYMEVWHAWYAELWPQELRDAYAAKYPEPEGWTGFYRSLDPQVSYLAPVVRLSRRALFGDLPDA